MLETCFLPVSYNLQKLFRRGEDWEPLDEGEVKCLRVILQGSHIKSENVEIMDLKFFFLIFFLNGSSIMHFSILHYKWYETWVTQLTILDNYLSISKVFKYYWSRVINPNSAPVFDPE